MSRVAFTDSEGVAGSGGIDDSATVSVFAFAFGGGEALEHGEVGVAPARRDLRRRQAVEAHVPLRGLDGLWV